MRTSRLLASVSASFAVFAIACSSSSSSSVSNDQAATDIAGAFCDATNKCSSLYIQISYGDVATCKTRFKLAVAPTLTANGTGATTSQYEACTADLAGASCDDLLARNLPQSCQTVAGTLADGAACGADAQCKGRLCRLADNSNCGACSSVVAAGGACTDSNQCDKALVCANSLCVAYGAAGASCDTNHPCKPTLSCTGGTCAVPGEAGATCPGIGTAGCDLLKGFFCNQQSVCATIGVSNAGGQCGLVNGVYTTCSGGGLCKGAVGLTPGTCVAPAADGATCDDANGPPCLAPASCTGGVCKVSDPSSCK